MDKKALLLFTIISIVILFSISGCIKEANLNFTQLSPYVGADSIDLNNDTKVDISTYVFSDIDINEGNQRIKISRYIYVHPEKFAVFYTDNDTYNSSYVYEITKSIITSSKDMVKECSNIIQKGCMSPQACVSSCRSGICEKQTDKSIGNVVYDFSDILNDYDITLDELAVQLSRANISGNYSGVFNTLSRLYVEEYILENHPLVREFGICKFSHSDSIPLLINPSHITIIPSQNRALVVEKFASYNLENPMELRLVETLPSSISDAISIYYLPDDAIVVSPNPLKYRYPQIKLTKDSTVYLSMMVDGSFPNTEIIFESWNNILGSVRVMVFDLPIVENSIKWLYSNIYSPIVSFLNIPYLSLAITFSLIILILMILFQILATLYAIIQTIFEPKKMKEAILLSLGEADLFWKRKLSVSITLLIIAYVIEMTMASRVNLQDFSQITLKEVFSSDVWGFISFVLYIVSISFLYEVVLDRIKRLIGGKFYENRYVEFTPEANMKRLEELKKLIEKAQKMFDAYSDMGIDTSVEYQTMMSIPVGDLEKLVRSDENPYIVNDKINEYIEKLSEAIEAVKNKEKIAIENWKKWESYIDEEISDKDTISIDTLVSIPYQWRLWAITRYIDEHPEENLVVEGRIVKRIKISGEEKVKRIIKSGVMRSEIIGGIYIKSGNFSGGYLPYEKPTVISGVLMRISAYFDSISSKLGSKLLIIEGDQISLIAKDIKSSDRVIVLCKKGDEGKAISFIDKRFSR